MYFWRREKLYSTTTPYVVLDLEKIFSNFLTEAINCDFVYNCTILKIINKKHYKIITKSNEVLTKRIVDSRTPTIPGNNYLKQHFLGWFAKFDQVHNIKYPTIMDIDQSSPALCFTYIIPFSDKEALIELTYYSEDVYSQEHYEQTLKAYLSKRFPNLNYNIYKKESGVIPLVNFCSKNKSDYTNIGIRNGYLRASTGYSVFSSYFEISPNKLLKVLDNFLIKILWISPNFGGKIFTHFLKKISGEVLSNFMSYRPTFKNIFKAAYSMPLAIFLPFTFRKKGKLITNVKLGSNLE